MIYKYLLYCRQAGLSEEQIREINRSFDLQAKHLKREHAAQVKYNVYFVSMTQLQENLELKEVDIPDPAANVEDSIIHQLDIEKLRLLLTELPQEDRDFLYAYFEEPQFADTRTAQKLGIPRTTVRYRKKKLVAWLQHQFDSGKFETDSKKYKE